eukprot:GGOE01005538.1.p3 GENE.GGOE01005538.1~~GGOE01005538.1.p3  ORF type:complete len:127 (-),score=7.02 GGOE01005538.1:336-716(-)
MLTFSVSTSKFVGNQGSFECSLFCLAPALPFLLYKIVRCFGPALSCFIADPPPSIRAGAGSAGIAGCRLSHPQHRKTEQLFFAEYKEQCHFSTWCLLFCLLWRSLLPHDRQHKCATGFCPYSIGSH